ncbi:MAG: hypothetical protein ACLFTB_07185 [Desulfovibrionales bacterium]
MNAAELPWWLEEGYETCSFCLQHYSYEMEYRCRECDAPVCPMCTTHAHEEAVTCPDCHCGEAS